VESMETIFTYNVTPKELKQLNGFPEGLTEKQYLEAPSLTENRRLIELVWLFRIRKDKKREKEFLMQIKDEGLRESVGYVDLIME